MFRDAAVRMRSDGLARPRRRLHAAARRCGWCSAVTRRTCRDRDRRSRPSRAGDQVHAEFRPVSPTRALAQPSEVTWTGRRARTRSGGIGPGRGSRSAARTSTSTDPVCSSCSMAESVAVAARAAPSTHLAVGGGFSYRHVGRRGSARWWWRSTWTARSSACAAAARLSVVRRRGGRGRGPDHARPERAVVDVLDARAHPERGGGDGPGGRTRLLDDVLRAHDALLATCTPRCGAVDARALRRAPSAEGGGVMSRRPRRSDGRRRARDVRPSAVLGAGDRRAHRRPRAGCARLRGDGLRAARGRAGRAGHAPPGGFPLVSSAAWPRPSTRRPGPTGGSPATAAAVSRAPRAEPRPPQRAVAGEHGFRFFPAYYLHIWDMLQRIPLYSYDADGRRREPGNRPRAR